MNFYITKSIDCASPARQPTVASHLLVMRRVIEQTIFE